LLKQEETILYGKSLGTGVASYLSSVRPSKAIILITPYDSLRAVAQANYPIIPVKYLLRHHFDSMSFLENYKNPLLIVYGGKDVVIPNQHTKNLIAHTQSGTEVFFVEQAGHDDILDFPESEGRINAFLSEVMKRR
jgi:pimeloyl-ACP methyl ester carboxylesterase